MMPAPSAQGEFEPKPAALLGQRYGRRGLIVVALGGLPCIIQWRYSSLFGGG